MRQSAPLTTESRPLAAACPVGGGERPARSLGHQGLNSWVAVALETVTFDERISAGVHVPGMVSALRKPSVGAGFVDENDLSWNEFLSKFPIFWIYCPECAKYCPEPLKYCPQTKNTVRNPKILSAAILSGAHCLARTVNWNQILKTTKRFSHYLAKLSKMHEILSVLARILSKNLKILSKSTEILSV